MMITMVNYKKCRAMKKIITTILIAAAAFTACVQNNDEIIVKNEKISFNATLNAPVSRTVLVEQDGKFHAEWTAGDHIELFEITTVGTTNTKANNPVVNLAEGGATASVEFTLEAKSADSYTYLVSHNNASMQGKGLYIAFDLPATQKPTAMNTFDSLSDFLLSNAVITTAQPTGAINFNLSRVTAIAKVTVKGLKLAADEAVERVTFSCENDIAGKRTNIMTEDIKNGLDPLTQATVASVGKSITVVLPEAQSGEFSYYMNLWPETLAVGSNYIVKVVTNAGKEYIKEATIAKDLEFTSGNITAVTVNMAGIGEDIDTSLPYVEVAGIKWATGNLEYEVNGTTSKGFVTNWSIAPSQEHHFYIGTTGDNKSISNYDKVSHFNFGGIGEGALHINPTSAVHLPGETAFDFSGKMYTDQDCTIATTDFAAAKYGDVAYWASNGQYRMPSKVDMETLYSKACRTLASYNGVEGTYFYNPGEGETAGNVEGTKALFESDLEVGLFLPNAGRGYDNADYTLFNINTIGMYRTSTVQENSKTGVQGYGVILRANKLDETCDYYNSTIRTKGDPTYAYGACGRYCIRPIYIAE